MIVALEGGGSKTVAIGVTLDGRVVAFGRAGSSLALYVGEEQATKAVETATGQVAEAIDPATVAVVAGAMVGKGFSADPAAVVRRLFPHAQFMLIHEGNAALIGATLSHVGAVVLSGTGAFGRAVGKAGVEGHVGGNGPLVGDEGSGYWIAIEAIRRALWSVDGRGKPTELVGDICRHYGLERIGWIIGRLYGRSPMGRHEIASLAPVVIHAYRRGDEVATQILAEAGQLLAQQALAAIRNVWARGDGWDGPIPFGCSGGVLFGSPELREIVVSEVSSLVPIEPREPRLPPVGGVALEALRQAGVPFEEGLVEALATTLPVELGPIQLSYTTPSSSA